MTLLTIPSLTPTQRQILESLFQEGGLSTNLIAQYVVPGLVRNQVVNELTRLRELQLVSSAALGAGASEEYGWVVRYAGARALGHRVMHTDARYRPPGRAQLDQKAMTLRLQVTMENLNWEYVRPGVYNGRHPKPVETPQRAALVRAVAAHFAATVPSAGTVRLHPSQVPGGLNDWVAWPAGQG